MKKKTNIVRREFCSSWEIVKSNFNDHDAKTVEFIHNLNIFGCFSPPFRCRLSELLRRIEAKRETRFLLSLCVDLASGPMDQYSNKKCY